MRFNTKWVVKNTHSDEMVTEKIVQVDASKIPLEEIVASMQTQLEQEIPPNCNHVAIRCAGAWPV